MFWIIGYGLILFGIGFYYFLKHKNQTLDGFIVYERQANWFSVGMSLVALVFGASSVFGLARLGYQNGWNGIWWTLSGVIFLLILSFTFAGTIWRTKSYTISDIITRAFGEEIRFFISLVVFLAWMIVLAGQIVAGANIIGLMLHSDYLGYILFTLIFASYTILIGQAGAVKSGLFQTLLMAGGLLVLLVLTLLSPQKGVIDPKPLHFGPDFPLGKFFIDYIPVGLVYLFGPDIYSRIFTARSRKSAQGGLIFGSVLILGISIIIVLIGIYSKNILGPLQNPEQAIPMLFTRLLTGPLSMLVLVALISIPLSGADIMLITNTTLLTKDLLQPVYRKMKDKPKKALQVFRLTAFLVALLSAGIAFYLKNIIQSLMISYKIFTVGVGPLLLVSLIAIRLDKDIRKKGTAAFLGGYILLSSLLVLVIELKWIKAPVQAYNLWMILLNTFLLLILMMVFGRKKTSTSGAPQV